MSIQSLWRNAKNDFSKCSRFDRRVSLRVLGTVISGTVAMDVEAAITHSHYLAASVVTVGAIAATGLTRLYHKLGAKTAHLSHDPS